MRSIAAWAGVAVVSALLAAPAGASTLHGENGIVTYTAAPGHDNVAQFAPNGPAQVQFTNPDHKNPMNGGPNDGDPVTATGTCRKDDSWRRPDRFLCDDVTVGVVAYGGDGDDEMGSGLINLQARLSGGEGDDLLGDYDMGVATVETFDGGPGDDQLISGAGADVLIGGPGTDIARMNVFADPPQPVSITLDGVANDGGPGTNADIRPDVESASGGSVARYKAGYGSIPGAWPTFGPFTIVGDAGPNALTAYSPGTVVGGEGSDTLTGSIYDDTIDSADESADVLHCLDGTDSARVDGQDTVSPDCEVVTYAERVQPAATTLKVRAARRARFTVTGQVVRPGTIPAQRACGAGRVAITVRAKGRKVAAKRTALRSDCSYRRRFAVRRAKRRVLSFTASYRGNAVMTPKASITVRRRGKR